MAEKRVKNSNVPNLRFPGFTEEWEEIRLFDITEKINSGKTPLGGESVYLSKGIVFIRSQNVNNEKLELENPVFISEEVNATMKNSMVKPNDILLNITGASLGRSCVVPDDFALGNVNQHVCIIRLKENYNPRFLQPIFSSAKGQSIFESLQTGSGREGLNFDSIKKIILKMPVADEQLKIASFLSLLNKRIETQNKIIEHLQTLIKQVSHKIFNQEVRFKDIGGGIYPDWKVKNIGDLLTIGSGKDYKHLKKGDIPVFGTGGLMTYVNSFLYNGETVCIGRKGTIDKPMYYHGKIWTVDTLFYSHSFLKVVPKFVFYLFKMINWKEFNEASGVPSLSKNTIERIEVEIPSLAEQKKIEKLLSVIDDKITIEKNLLKNYKMQKRHLLQNLFI